MLYTVFLTITITINNVPLKIVSFLVFLLNLFSLLDDTVNVVSKQFWESEH